MEKQINKPGFNGDGQHRNQLKGQDVKYSLYLVLNYNDRRLVATEKFDLLIRELITFTGGATRLAPCPGWWISKTTQRTYEDMVTVVEVIVPDSIDAQLFFLAFAAKVARVLEQESVLVTRQPIELFSIERGPRDSNKRLKTVA